MVKAEAPAEQATTFTMGVRLDRLSTKSPTDREYVRDLVVRSAQSVLGVELEATLQPYIKKQKAGKEFTGSNAIAIISTSFIVAAQSLDWQDGGRCMEYVSAAFYKEHIAEDMRRMQEKQRLADEASVLGKEYVRRPVKEYTLTDGERTIIARAGPSDKLHVMRDIFRSRDAQTEDNGANGDALDQKIRTASSLIVTIDAQLSRYAQEHGLTRAQTLELEYVAEIINTPHTNKRARFESERTRNKFPHTAPKPTN